MIIDIPVIEQDSGKVTLSFETLEISDDKLLNLPYAKLKENLRDESHSFDHPILILSSNTGPSTSFPMTKRELEDVWELHIPQPTIDTTLTLHYNGYVYDLGYLESEKPSNRG